MSKETARALDVKPRGVHVDKDDFDIASGEHENAMPLTFQEESDQRAQD